MSAARHPLARLAPLVLAALVWSGPGHADAPPGRYCITPGPTPAETIVRDSATGLTWLQPVAPGVRPWAEAITYCDGLGAAGKSWRLPSVKELLTLGDETGVAPAVDPTAFPDTPMGSFWSISTRPDDPTLAWSAAGMGNNAEKKTVQNLVRCVMR